MKEYNFIKNKWYKQIKNQSFYKFDRFEYNPGSQEYDSWRFYYSEQIERKHSKKSDFISNSDWFDWLEPATEEEIRKYIPDYRENNELIYSLF